MAKRYREPLEEVAVGPDATPTRFRWRGRRYEVVRVLGHWREEAGWWLRPADAPLRIEQADLWRVEARDGAPTTGVYELACRGGAWRLERVWD